MNIIRLKIENLSIFNIFENSYIRKRSYESLYLWTMATIAEASTHLTNDITRKLSVKFLGRKECTHTLTRFSTFERITTVCSVSLDRIYQGSDTCFNVFAFCWHWLCWSIGWSNGSNGFNRSRK